MRPGDLIAGRFELARPARWSAPGDVVEAFDRHAGGVVALRRLAAAPGEWARIERAAAILAELRHPSIARHVAHGETGDGALFVATEWIDGAPLAASLAAGPMSVADTLLLAKRLAAALSLAHAKGLAHGGLAPRAVILRGGAVKSATLIEIGTGRPAAEAVTTRGHLAPEQARGEAGEGARADVFSLGCVLFECLAGRPPFTGDDPIAVLAKVVLEEAPRAASLRADVPEALDALVSRMMAKSPSDRPADAASLALELASIDTAMDRLSNSEATAPDVLTERDRRRLYAALAVPGAEGAEAPRAGRDAIAAALAPHGARVDHLAGGGVLATIAGSGNDTDQAAHAAFAALALRRLLPGAHVALTTRVGTLVGELPVGDVVDHAARMVGSLRVDGGSAGVRIDEPVCGLLDARFDVGGDARGLELRGERAPAGSPYAGPDGASRFEGRDDEIAALTSAFHDTVDEELGRAMIVAGPAGSGKTRLVAELLDGLAESGEPVEVWSARGDPSGEGARFGVAGELVRSAAGIRADEPLVVRQQKLRARVRRHVASRHAERVTGFLAEISGVSQGDRESARVRAARADPRAMLEGIRLAFEDLLSVECDARPVVLVIDDLHLADDASVALIGSALGGLRERRLFVLATVRPEVNDRFPGLWADRAATWIALEALPRDACVRLVRAAVGDITLGAVVESLVARAAGNPRRLEELIAAERRERGAP